MIHLYRREETARVRLFVGLASLLGMLGFVLGCGKEDPKVAGTVTPTSESSDEARFENQIVRFCGGCHGMPRPESFPKASWEEEVEQGYELYFESGRTDLKPPIPKSRVLAYFTDRAAEEFTVPLPEPTTVESPFQFEKRDLKLSDDGPPIYASHVKFAEDTSDLGTGLFVCDMNEGRLLWASPSSAAPTELLETFHHPAHVTVCDLDQDSVDEYLIADLGSFLPSDHSDGKLYWLRRTQSGEWEKMILLKDVGRVTSCKTGDFDGDGITDIVVAEFGWRKTGAIHLIKGGKTENGIDFRGSEIDPRSGAIDVQLCDLNGDGRLDFVALLAQHHEAVVAFLNKGDATFETQVLWEADYPSYGSSGFELCDLDADGDLDVIYTNGDSFDDFHIKPYHYIQWLENKGTYPFERRQIAEMPGVHRALPGDFDGDGDTDIVAVGMLPEEVRNPGLRSQLDSVILLEQTDGQEFIRHRVETGFSKHASVAVGDFDADSDVDFAVGIFRHEEDVSTLSLWINQRVPNETNAD